MQSLWFEFKAATAGKSLLKVGISASHVGRKSTTEHWYLKKEMVGGNKTIAYTRCQSITAQKYLR